MHALNIVRCSEYHHKLLLTTALLSSRPTPAIIVLIKQSSNHCVKPFVCGIKPHSAPTLLPVLAKLLRTQGCSKLQQNNDTAAAAAKAPNAYKCC
jgi:hypothetical protein